MKRYDFPPMLGPASAQPEGTQKWAECLANELDYRVSRAEQYGVDDLVPLIRMAISSITPPWTVWPEPPCGSVDRYFMICTGLTYEQLWQLINTYKADHGLARSMDVTRATEQAISTKSGRPSIHTDSMNKPKAIQSGSKAYLLRRIAREAPQALEAYERGEFKSARAAADAAGIPKTNRAVRMRSEWKHASPEEREEFLDFLRSTMLIDD